MRNEKDKTLTEVLISEPRQIIMCLFNELFYYCDIKASQRTHKKKKYSHFPEFQRILLTLFVPYPWHNRGQTSGAPANRT